MSSMPHLMLDIYGVNREVLTDEKEIEALITAITAVIDMKIVAGPFIIPFVHKARTGSLEHFTLDGIVIIATSHVSIHTLPHKNMLFVDVFSCKSFDQERVLALVCEWLKVTPENIDRTPVERATRSPREEIVSA